MKKKGFTLIELLIVVAIIAILAAIAVPNFLEAQTRAKVSRSKADIRSIAIAIEAYRLDNNKYFPPDQTRQPFANYDSWGDIFSLWWLRVIWTNTSGTPYVTPAYLGAFLTTPIAYMTDVPLDPFNSNYDQRSAHQGWSNHVEEGAAFYGNAMNNSVLNMRTPSTFITDVGYFLFNIGPDLRYNLQWAQQRGRSSGKMVWEFPNGGQLNLYDPTNGTISAGEIYYAGRGGGFVN